ncbi:MAG: ABC transporter ATP-binding protein/permease [Chloroflexota bacterium]|nr:ABC transporter ATP-binding protein/permease [Chloroflexota bacterium]
MASSNGSGPKIASLEPRPGWRERVQRWIDAYGNIPDAFRLVWAASRNMTIVMLVLTLISALLPPAQAWVGKLIVDRVVELIQASSDAWIGLRAMLPLLGLEFVLIFMGSVSSQVRSLAEHILNSQLNLHINTLIIRKALALDLSYFEDADFYDKLQNARKEADWRALRIVTQTFSLLQGIITLLSFALLLIRFSPWLTVILFGATIPSFVAQNKYAHLNFRMLSWRAPERRKMTYFEHLLTVDSYVKEIKLFGVGEPILGRYRQLFTKFFREDEALARRRSLASLGWGLLATLSYYFSYAWIIFRTISGAITLGDMTLYLSVFRQSQSTFQGIFLGLSSLYENSLFMSNLFSFLGLEPQMVPAKHPHPMPERIRHGIEFRNVSFRYPGREDWALRHVNLTLQPGEKLALVGANGAGKTTLIKLLTRLYDPTEGQILLDGVDLREYDLAEWRQKIGVIFQDFVRYHLSANENVGMGQWEALDDQLRIKEAARRGGADTVLSALPEGYDTVLGKWFKDGHDLSGGEWQKVALSRAFMRDAEILVLDEPTAALDAEQEYLIFQRFRELTEGKIAVLISHRFSTVRMADRIAVIEEGHIAELGSHEELMAQGGTYSHLFNIQAQGYR